MIPPESGTVISYPIPANQNEPIHANYFEPSQFLISAIALGPVTTVTTTTNMNYVIGQQCRLLIPAQYGSSQLSNQAGYVIAIPATNEVTLDINSSINVDAFINFTPTTPLTQSFSYAQILAIGDINAGAQNQTNMNSTTFVPGSFINISPE